MIWFIITIIYLIVGTYWFAYRVPNGPYFMIQLAGLFKGVTKSMLMIANKVAYWETGNFKSELFLSGNNMFGMRQNSRVKNSIQIGNIGMFAKYSCLFMSAWDFFTLLKSSTYGVTNSDDYYAIYRKMVAGHYMGDNQELVHKYTNYMTNPAPTRYNAEFTNWLIFVFVPCSIILTFIIIATYSTKKFASKLNFFNLKKKGGK